MHIKQKSQKYLFHEISSVGGKWGIFGMIYHIHGLGCKNLCADAEIHAQETAFMANQAFDPW